MRFAWSTALKDLRRRLRDPFGLLLWFALPLFIGVTLRLAFGGPRGPAPRAHVLVVDRDDGALSRLLVGALSQGGEKSPLRGEQVSSEEGERRMQAGQATALLVIPEGFGRAVLREQPASLRLVTNPAERILPALVRESVGLLPDLVFYAHRLLGDSLLALQPMLEEGAGPPSDAELARLAFDLSRRFRDLAPQLTSSAPFELKVEVPPQPPGPAPSFGQMFVPSLLFMALFFTAGALSEDVWIERQSGTLRRALLAPQAASSFLLGKLLAGALLFAAVALVSLAGARWGFGLAMHGLPLAVLWAAASGVLFLLLLAVLQLHASSQRTGGLLANVVLLPLLMLGGSLLPFEVMPEWMAAIGRLTPNGWALAGFKAILAGTLDTAAVAVRFLGLLAVGALLFAVALRRLRGAFGRGA